MLYWNAVSSRIRPHLTEIDASVITRLGCFKVRPGEWLATRVLTSLSTVYTRIIEHHI